ncbi:MAG: ankyrin repeat domain-containing protein [Chlamydiales bacterium]|nr:ankyrin repeat domain-containing protein [Chlamydiales bacterium]
MNQINYQLVNQGYVPSTEGLVEDDVTSPCMETQLDDVPLICEPETILQAIILGDLLAVRKLMSECKLETLNVPGAQGLTPIHAAVQSGNVHLAKELLQLGASESVNVPNLENMTPLASAVNGRNDEMVLLLLEHGASPSIVIADNKGLTPFQRAIIAGSEIQVKAMLEMRPGEAANLNRPDSFGVTNLQRAARSGNVDLMSYLVALSIDQEILTNQEAYFSPLELEACTTTSEMEILKAVPIEAFAFPLTIAQSSCNVMVRLEDGRVLHLRNVNAVEVRDHLMTAKYGSEWVSDQGANVLVAYLSPGHGFLRLECRNCDEGQPFNNNRGFYPRGMKLTGAIQNTAKRIQEPDTQAVVDDDSKTTTSDFANLAIGDALNLISTSDSVEQMIGPLSLLTLFVANLSDQKTGSEILISKQEIGKLRDYVNSRNTVLSDAGGLLATPFSIVLEHMKSLANEDGHIDFEDYPSNLHIERAFFDAMVQTGIHCGNATQKALQLLSNMSPDPHKIIEVINFILDYSDEFEPLLLDDEISITEVIDALADGVETTTALATYVGTLAKRFVPLGKGAISVTGKVSRLTANGVIYTAPSVASLGVGAVFTAGRVARYAAEGVISNAPAPISIFDGIPSPGVIKKTVGSFAREARYAYQDYIVNNFMMTQEQVGNIGNENWYENDSDTRNSLKIMFYVTDDQAKKALDTIHTVETSCVDNPEQACSYFLTSENCIDFVSKVFKNAGGAGEVMDYVTDQQVGYGHLHSPTRIFEFKAVEYAYIKARGFSHYLKAGTYVTLNSLVNLLPFVHQDLALNSYSLPHHFVNAKALLPPTTSVTTGIPQLVGSINPKSTSPSNWEGSSQARELETFSVNPALTSGFADNLALTLVLSHTATNCFKGIKNWWAWHKGEKASSRVVKDFCTNSKTTVKKQIKILEAIDQDLSDQRTEIYQGIEESDGVEELQYFYALKKQLNRLQGQQLDLVYEGMELSQSYKKMTRSRTPPSQKFLAQCEQDLARFVRNCRSFQMSVKREFCPHQIVKIVA